MNLADELSRHAVAADQTEQAGLALLAAAVGVLQRHMDQDVVAKLLRDMAAHIARGKIKMVK